MSLESLFLKEVSEKNDLSLTSLPKDMDQWTETVVSKIKEKLPQSKNLLMKVVITNKDEEQGTATGALTLHDQKLNKSIYVPVIAHNFKLYPMDVMIVPSKNSEKGMEVVPLTKENFEQCMFNSDTFSHLERPMDRIQQLYMNPQNSVVYPPYFRNVHASGNMLDAISDTISKEDRQNFNTFLKENPQVVVSYEKRANLDILQKVAESTSSLDTENKKQRPRKALSPGLVIVKKNMDGNYHISYTEDEIFNPIFDKGNREYAKERLKELVKDPEEALSKVERNGEYLVFDKSNPADGVSIKDMKKERYADADEDPINIKEFGSYRVMDKNGVQHKGLVFPNVINFDKKQVGAKIFYKGDKTAYQTKIVGIPTKANPLQFVRGTEPAVGMTGFYAVFGKEGKALATVPITIRSITEHGSEDRIIAEDMNGKKLKLKHEVGSGLSSMEEVKKESFDDEGTSQQLRDIVKIKDFYLLPSSFIFIPLSNNFCSLDENPGDMYMKVASKKWDAMPIKIAHTGAQQFSVKGPDMEKMASSFGWNTNNLSGAQTAFLLTAKRAPLEKTGKALKSALAYGQSEVHHLPRTKYASEQQVKTASNNVKHLRVNLIKEAGKIEEAEIVDTILSLNFINSENVSKFISMVPYMKECTKMLAQALLASRLGMKEIPEQDTQTAMYKLVDVIKGLEKLEDTTNDV